MTKPPGRCIFCNGFGLTKEHVFADWLRAVFPRDAHTTHTHGVINFPPGTQPRINSRRRQGHSGTRKVRVVCRRCNNGWMHDLEDDVKPILSLLMAGRTCQLSTGIQDTLATWAVKTVMTAEFITPKAAVITPTERRFLYDNRRPPDLWHVWCGAYAGLDWRNLTLYEHTGNLEVPAISSPGPQSHYLQATTFGLGHVLFFVLSTSWPRLEDILAQMGYPGLCRLWPPLRATISWPPAHVLSDVEARVIAGLIGRVLEQPIKP